MRYGRIFRKRVPTLSVTLCILKRSFGHHAKFANWLTKLLTTVSFYRQHINNVPIFSTVGNSKGSPVPREKIAASRKPRSALAAVVLAVATPVIATDSETTVLRIGTGGSGGTYYTIGSLLAESISDSDTNRKINSYSIPGLQAMAQHSNGSVSNVTEIGSGLLEAGLAQADVVHWAYHGIGPFGSTAANPELRVVGSLYLESLHLVVRTGLDIKSIRGLKGLRVSFDEIGSGTYTDVRPLVRAFGLSEEDIEVVYLKPIDAIDRLLRNKLDGFFILAGYPINAVKKLIDNGDAKIVSIAGPEVDKLLSEFQFFIKDSVPPGTYANEVAVPTISVAAQLIVSVDLDIDLVYGITKLLWEEKTLHRLSEGHAKGHDIQLESALSGISIPLHQGAEKYYRENGVLNNGPSH